MMMTERDTETVHEAYSFVCLHCGHGWEEEYEIRHTPDAGGRRHAEYFCHGRRVPSPLTHTDCPGCTRGPIRILRPGRVKGMQAYLG
ncbi:hypothetical protein MUU72_20925 [Streptomyces sp. RS10V-4]|nr:hypothetical protein [Streptomyces rhizoryzae]